MNKPLTLKSPHKPLTMKPPLGTVTVTLTVSEDIRKILNLPTTTITHSTGLMLEGVESVLVDALQYGFRECMAEIKEKQRHT